MGNNMIDANKIEREILKRQAQEKITLDAMEKRAPIDKLLTKNTPEIVETSVNFEMPILLDKDSMTFGGSKLDKGLNFSLLIFLELVSSFVFFNYKSTFSNAEIIVIVATYIIINIVIIYVSYYSDSSNAKIIIGKEGIILQDYPLTPWNEIVGTYIKTITNGEDIIHYFVVALNGEYYREQLLPDGAADIAHYCQLYKKNYCP